MSEETEGHSRADGVRGRDASLDVGSEELREMAARVGQMAADYFEEVSARAVFPVVSAESVARLFRRELPDAGETLAEVLDGCRAVFDASRHNGHPRMFGYVASPAAPVGAFANLLASALNANVTSWRSGPAATEIERLTIGWLAELVGYTEAGQACGGLLTSGGSMANLIALYVAHRTHARGGAQGASFDPSRAGLWGAGAPMTVYASDQIHLSITKAADILGLGREHVRTVASDENYRLDARALAELIDADARAGLRPFCVVASAGTVNTGAVDPLAEVARVADQRGLWLHVDGAYGALARLDASKRALFDGLAAADSVSLDPHKWLSAPLDCGCLLMREPARARAAFAGTEEDYIHVYGRGEEDPEAFAFWDYGVELSRPFRALKVWAMLRYYGRARLSASITEDCALAAYMGARVEAAEDFELLAPVTLGICCFRYVPHTERLALERAAGDGDERERVNLRLDCLNERVMQAVQRGGAAYVSNASLRGRFSLRASITNFRTTRRDIDLTLDIVRRAARKLKDQ